MYERYESSRAQSVPLVRLVREAEVVERRHTANLPSSLNNL